MIDSLLARGVLPDFVIRRGIRHLNRRRLKEISAEHIELAQAKAMQLVEQLRNSEIAVLTEKANEQHYEVPAEFFALVLGKNRKYSSCYYPTGRESLDEGEDLMLAETVSMARLANGQKILELGCGWGSLSLYMAAKFPRASVTGVSNSASQKAYIDGEAKRRGLRNLKIITADVNRFAPKEKFDRVVSVEMFEHMRNYDALFARVRSWLKADGHLFIHIFTHRDYPYLFEDKGPDDWMGRYFFSGGIMPSNHLFSYFAHGFSLVEQRIFKGTHYHLTSEAWRRNMDKNRDAIAEIFARVYGKENVTRWINYWRVFFLAVSELFRTRGGEEWNVSHYLYKRV
ncbi:MAG: class I SAM-dependent methyltransferase [Spirochaetes bacterium]|nr:class I SAM-dependent methyltransferase [Spirochaetota bacterium]